MKKSADIRQAFLDFFASKEHNIVPSAPMLVKNDPTLMFTNAGMNQFKDIFLGNAPAKFLRVADTQKCLRVSGKHNDLEEVGHDTYHHTMFEMLGNWSFGDYFKKEAIAWAWEFLTSVLEIDRNSLYVTVFGGDEEDDLAMDEEALQYWKKIVPEERILFGSKKDNFWEMGDTGPCGPCSEIHVDLRSVEEKEAVSGDELVNADHPEVIEIWNLVFIEFNRKADGKLVALPAKHVDTGMGFERLCMAIQQKKSNYDTDIFQPIIRKLGELTGKQYGSAGETDTAMRVVADHLRAVSFAIADGQLPSNVGAGYVIRRILRRAVRYGYTFLEMQDPFIAALVPVLVAEMGDVFPELKKQQDLINRVITEEEVSFQRTLAQGVKRFDAYLAENKSQKKVIDGQFAFELFDTFGFPIDLTQLMAREKGWDVDMAGFEQGLQAQKERSRKAAEKDTGDWNIIEPFERTTEFVGYDRLEADVRIMRYRAVKNKKKTVFEMVFDITPFYAESGGQVGDSGWIMHGGEKIRILDTVKENDLIVHIGEKEPSNAGKPYKALIDQENRISTANNHSATHLMHDALRKVLGDHIEQKGSLVDPEHLRFDFSHFQKVNDDEIRKIEQIVNAGIRKNHSLDEHRTIPIEAAKEMGALAFFGEKYGDVVRVIRFGESIELCGGTHVPSTGQIGFFKIISEGAIAAGVRRIEAITGKEAERFILEQDSIIRELKGYFKSQNEIIKGVNTLIADNDALRKEILKMKKEMAQSLSKDLEKMVEKKGRVSFLARKIDADMETVRDLAFNMTNKMSDLVLVAGFTDGTKAFLTVAISKDLAGTDGFHAGKIIRELSSDIGGGGGGQPHYATAGGKNVNGIDKALEHAGQIVDRLSSGN